MAFVIPLGYAILGALAGGTTVAVIVNKSKEDEIKNLKD